MIARLKSSSSAIAIAAALGIATPAAGAEPGTVDWSGFYIGAHLGGGQAFLDGAFNADANSDSAVFFDRLNLKGIVGGVHGGYLWDMGDFVVGVEGDLTGVDWSDLKISPSSSDAADADVDFLASARARLGFAFGDRREFLAYATGGLAFAKAEVTPTQDLANGPNEELDFNSVGGVFGAGLEWAARSDLRFRVEGLYYLWDDRKGLTLPDANPGETAELDDAYVLRAGLSWFFNQPHTDAGIQPAASHSDPVDWGGMFVGAHLGGGQAFVDGIYRAGTESEVDFDKLDVRGIAGGAQLGFNWDLGNFVVGLEGDITWIDLQNTQDAPSSEEQGIIDIDILASARAKVGLPLGEDRRTLVYLTGGIALVSGDARLTGTPSGNETLDFDNVGGVFGGGVEWAATDSMRLRLDGLYYLFDEENDFSLGSANAGDFVGLQDAFVIRAGLNWHFDTPGL